ncbi:alanine racemase [Desulfuromusa kysingii]|uniref:Alanine racemase n=1 Tax=Desulfuromusa kysingii TaxID=37625 RepID=A0A1H3ZK69_9BACT|nr:alanine racemase [Desulfuromusa kysingii]SEA24169.1 alanine racemase [Desulfuromusa kysingii]
MTYSARPTWVDIDLSALQHNLQQALNLCSSNQRVLAVVKADAYGHGAVQVTRALQRFGVRDFAVATLEEALELRQAGIGDNLLILGGCFPGQEAVFLEFNLMPILMDTATAARLNAEALRRKRQIKVHLKVDSGMGRVGFLPAQLQEFLPQLRQLDGLIIEGFMSHLACADELDSVVTHTQQDQFLMMLQMVRDAGLQPREVHLNNSAGLSAWGCPDCTLSRPGIILYGGLPSPAFSTRLDLQPVMHLRSCIAQLRSLPAGSGISYGHSYHAHDNMLIAVLPIGYADGYNRLFSNRGQGILRGQKVPVVGKVCMDWIMLDVSYVTGVEIGDCVTLLGSMDDISITGDGWAEQLNTIPYEVFCRIGNRIPRRYQSVP